MLVGVEAAAPAARCLPCSARAERHKLVTGGPTRVLELMPCVGCAAILALCLPLKELAQLVNFGCALCST